VAHYEALRHFGHDQFVLCLGYRGNYIKEYFLNYEAMNSDCTIVLGARHEISYHGAHGESNFQVTLADTGEETMTGAASAHRQVCRRRHLPADLRRRSVRRGHHKVVEFHRRTEN